MISFKIFTGTSYEWDALFVSKLSIFFSMSVRDSFLKHGTIIQTGITCKKILFKKSIEFGIRLKWSGTHYKQKEQLFFVTRSPTC